jgi:hypothetical protein
MDGLSCVTCCLTVVCHLMLDRSRSQVAFGHPDRRRSGGRTVAKKTGIGTHTGFGGYAYPCFGRVPSFRASATSWSGKTICFNRRAASCCRSASADASSAS